jgi:hypothetical protein
VAGGGPVVGPVARVVRDRAEGLALGQIDEPLGHLAEGVLGVGAEVGEQVLDAGFAVLGGLGRG